MKKSIGNVADIDKLLAELVHLETRRRVVLDDLVRADPLVVGSLAVVRRTCGKSTCHCAQKDGSGHPTSVLMSTGTAGRRCQVVRKMDVEQLHTLVDRYRRFREGLRSLKLLESEMNDKLRELMSFRDVGYS